MGALDEQSAVAIGGGVGGAVGSSLASLTAFSAITVGLAAASGALCGWLGYAVLNRVE